MSLIDTARIVRPNVLDPYRNEALGLVLSAMMPLAAAFAMSGFVAFFDLEGVALYGKAGIAPLYMMLFPLWGAAHWFAAREGDAGHRAAHWVLGLIGWGLVYPFLQPILDPFLMGMANIVSFFLVVATAIRLAPVSQTAMALVLPSLAWVALAAIPGYVLVTNGWSPGFAVTVAALGESDGGR